MNQHIKKRLSSDRRFFCRRVQGQRASGVEPLGHISR